MKISNFPKKIGEFLKEVYSELKKVSWSPKRDVIRHTLTVIGFCLIFALFLGGLDYLFSYLINRFIL